MRINAPTGRGAGASVATRLRLGPARAPNGPSGRTSALDPFLFPTLITITVPRSGCVSCQSVLVPPPRCRPCTPLATAAPGAEEGRTAWGSANGSVIPSSARRHGQAASASACVAGSAAITDRVSP